MDLIKTFPNVRVSWPVITIDENFKNDMDKGVSIERRLAAMKAFHDAGVRTACFISPIFPEISGVKAIINRAKNDCNWIWLENLNLRGTFKSVVMEYIKTKYPELLPLYNDIYTKGDNTYWQALEGELQAFAKEQGLEYKTNDDTFKRPLNAPPVMVNYFYLRLRSLQKRKTMKRGKACAA